MGKGGETFLEKGFPSLPQAPSLPFQRLSTLSNPCSQFFPARMTLEWCAFQRECLQAAFGGTMKRGKATIRSAFFPAHAGTDSFRAASPFYESLGRWRGDASLAGGFGGGREEAFLERFLLLLLLIIIIKSILRSAQQKKEGQLTFLFKFLAGLRGLEPRLTGPESVVLPIER